MSTLDRQIAADADDCNKYWSGSWQFSISLGQQSLFAGAYDASYYQFGCGLRFINITIPKGAVIDTAYLIVTAWDEGGGNGATQWYSKIRGQAADNAATFSDLTDFDARDWAVATPVAWSGSAAWTDDVEYQSPEIKTLIQAIVNRAGWASGQAIAFSWDDFDDLSAHVLNRRAVWEYAGSSAKAVKLHIEYHPITTISPTGIEQPVVLGTPAVSKLQQLIFPTGIEQPTAVGTPTLTKVAPTLPDFPDWTLSVRLVGTEIFLPINVQGVSVTIPMDIKAVSIGSISVDIVAQTVGDVTISVAAQVVGVYLQPEWAALQGQQKSFLCSGGNLAYSYGAQAYYTVPTGKTLYITHMSFGCYASAAADADKDQIGYCHVRNHTDDTILAPLGCSGGGGMSFPTPLKLTAGKVLELKVIAYANHDMNAYAVCGGYEI